MGEGKHGAVPGEIKSIVLSKLAGRVAGIKLIRQLSNDDSDFARAWQYMLDRVNPPNKDKKAANTIKGWQT